jgi:hypothetical protein
MALLIEVQDARGCASPLTLHLGDTLQFYATGGRVRLGDDVVEILGPFLMAVIGDNGAVVAPMGSPNTILFRARRPGEALIDVITGDPFTETQTTAVRIIVQA